MENADLRIRCPHAPTYPSVARANQRLKPRKKTPSGPRISRFGRSSSAERAGLSVSALNAEMMTDTAIVNANCWYMRPVMPGMKAVGMNTADRTSAIPTTGPDTSSIALKAASRGDIPCSMWCSTASTTTMASSTTSPMASTRPKSDSVLMEKPRAGNSMNVPTSDTGTASSGISVARKPCRKTKTTMTTRMIASTSVLTISLMPSVTASVVSSAVTYSRSWGNRAFASSISLVAAFMVSMAFEPGSW